MDLSVVAAVASIAAGVSILVAIAAVVAARRSTAHADLALKEASRISRASISRINEVQSEASSARLAARHAAERLRSMTKERTTPDSVAAYRIFLKEVVEDSKHLLGPEGTGTMQNESLDRLRVGALVGGSDEVLRALRNFALLRTHRPEAPWPSAYAMAYARLESDLVTAIRNDLGSSEESLTADQIWGAVNARCVDPAFRLALLSPLEDVLRNAGQDPTHYDLDHIVKPADYPGLAEFADSTAPTGSVSSAGAASSTGGHRRRSRRVQSRVAREASARATETAAAATGATTASTAASTTASTALPESDVVWTPLSPGHRGAHTANTGTSATTDVMSSAAASFAPPHEPAAASAIPAPLAPLQGDQPSGTEPSPAASVEAAQTDALDGPSAASSADARGQAAAARQTPSAETTSRTAPTQPPETIPTSHRALETRSGAFEDPTPSRITRRRRAQDSKPVPSTRASSAAPETTASPTTAAPVRASAASWAPSSTAPTSGIPTASASTKETEAVRAPALPTAPARSHAAEPGESAAPDALRTPASRAASTEPTQPQPRPRPTRTRSGSTPSTTSPVRAVAVAARTVAVTPGPQPSGASAAPTASARAAGAAGAAETGGYGIITTPGTAHAPAQAQGRAGLPAPDPAGLPDLPEPQPAEQTSAVAAAGAVPTSAVGAHRAAAAPARAAVPTSPVPTTDPDTQETVTVPTAPRTPVPTAAPTATAWSFAPPSLQDSAEIPRARGA